MTRSGTDRAASPVPAARSTKASADGPQSIPDQAALLKVPETGRPVVVITGAAGGLGFSLVEGFARTGSQVIAGWHQKSLERWPDRVEPVRLDVTRSDSVKAVFADITRKFGRIDVLVNNAGTLADRPLALLGEAEWDQVVAVNLRGAFLCAQAALGPMLGRRDGHIINIASFSARSGSAGQTAYTAAKAGVIGLTQSLAAEAGAHNVRVNAILPGVLPTPMTADLPAAVRERLTIANALGRLNELDEVVRFLVFLSTTRNISGQVFQLDSRIAPWT